MARKLLSTTDFATARGVTPGRIRQLINEGRIPEAKKFGSSDRSPWYIPENARILYPPERNRSFEKIKDWLRGEDWSRELTPHGNEKIVREFVNDADYWIEHTE